MSRTCSAIFIHVVFSTKNRHPFLVDSDLRIATHEYIGGISKNLGSTPHSVGGMEDHVHVLADLGRSIRVADWVKEMKRSSALWLKESKGVGEFAWQTGYGAFSVSQWDVSKIRNYILNQEAHHKKATFQEEFSRILKKHNIEVDEKYLWD